MTAFAGSKVQLYFYDGLKYEKIADILDVSLSTAHREVQKGIAALQKALTA